LDERTADRLVGAMSGPPIEADPPVRPRLRGWLHAAVAPASVAAAVALLVVAPHSLRPALVVYAVTVVLVFSISGAYHRLGWRTRYRLWWQRADHSGIFLFIAGSVTPVAVLALRSALEWVLLAVVWLGAATGVALVWTKGSGLVVGVLYVALGWSGIVALPSFVAVAGAGAAALLVVGGLCYTTGAVVNARRRPDPWPTAFGYHEVFHVLTIVGAAAQFVALAVAATGHGQASS
jgi:hemolysin III